MRDGSPGVEELRSFTSTVSPAPTGGGAGRWQGEFLRQQAPPWPLAMFVDHADLTGTSSPGDDLPLWPEAGDPVEALTTWMQVLNERAHHDMVKADGAESPVGFAAAMLLPPSDGGNARALSEQAQLVIACIGSVDILVLRPVANSEVEDLPAVGTTLDVSRRIDARRGRPSSTADGLGGATTALIDTVTIAVADGDRVVFSSAASLTDVVAAEFASLVQSPDPQHASQGLADCCESSGTRAGSTITVVDIHIPNTGQQHVAAKPLRVVAIETGLSRALAIGRAMMPEVVAGIEVVSDPTDLTGNWSAHVLVGDDDLRPPRGLSKSVAVFVGVTAAVLIMSLLALSLVSAEEKFIVGVDRSVVVVFHGHTGGDRTVVERSDVMVSSLTTGQRTEIEKGVSKETLVEARAYMSTLPAAEQTFVPMPSAPSDSSPRSDPTGVGPPTTTVESPVL